MIQGSKNLNSRLRNRRPKLLIAPMELRLLSGLEKIRRKRRRTKKVEAIVENKKALPSPPKLIQLTLLRAN